MKKYKPTTPSRRQMANVEYRKLLTRTTPHKALTKGGKHGVGRNSAGRITTRHKGGGNKKRYRDVDFYFNKKNIPARIESIEYDPYRSAFIALALYRDGERRYVLAWKGAKVGDSFTVGENIPPIPGNRLPLKNIPVGTFVNSVELKPEGGAKLARSAGNFVQIVAIADGFAQLKMPSSEVRKVNELSWATVGEISNDEHHLINYGKAGRSRHRGIRPTVRGSAMNPVDHPYGGGEGAQGRGTKRPKSIYGKITGGRKTRRPSKYSDNFIVNRRRKGKKKD
jgi:large subunit ribosomal protein L2